MNRTPRVAAVHDLSGLGRCSLSVILPVLSVMGIQCCPLPTAVLSAHTAFPAAKSASFLDLTPEMEQGTRHWRELGMDFDAIYSGFLGSARQISVLRQFIHDFRREDTLVLVDPVMGDHGKVYRTYTPEMCRLMGELAAQADLITPNATEAAILLEEDYANVPTTQAGMESWLARLSLDGRRSVVITGVSFAPGTVGAACLDCRTGKIRFAVARQEKGQFSGTGDLFASVVLGSILRGEQLPIATNRAVEFVQSCASSTLAAGSPLIEGVQFEPKLKELLR